MCFRKLHSKMRSGSGIALLFSRSIKVLGAQPLRLHSYRHSFCRVQSLFLSIFGLFLGPKGSKQQKTVLIRVMQLLLYLLTVIVIQLVSKSPSIKTIWKRLQKEREWERTPIFQAGSGTGAQSFFGQGAVSSAQS